MATTTTSWLGFVTTEEYRNDATAVNGTLEELAKEGGAIGVYHGMQREDPEFGYVVPIWSSAEKRAQFRAGSKQTPVLAALATKAGISGESMGVDFKVDPRPFLEVEVTEILTISSTDGKVKALLDELSGIVGGTWGASDRGEGEYVLVCGCACGKEAGSGVMGRLGEVATLQVHHASLVKAM